VIGLGGIGGWLVEPLGLYLNHEVAQKRLETADLTLIDGDKYEPRNKSRQVFTALGNKAEVTANRLSEKCDELMIGYKSEYITKANATRLIKEDHVILMCVDNHNSRKLISDTCKTLKNVILISGGNDGVEPENNRDGLTGTLQVYIRKNGKELTLPIDNRFHPEIDRPVDLNPGDTTDRHGCQTIANTSPQIVFTNFMVADMMLRAFYAAITSGVDYDEVVRLVA
jgi:hypothetical protein